MDKSLDYIIVGQGVAGSCFALKLIQENKSFIIIDQKQNQASRVAVGVFNALVLKRFALIWNAEEQLKWMKIYFEKFENLLQKKLIFNIPTYRILNNNNEISTWKDKAKREELKAFMNEEIVHQPISDAIKTPLGYAEVKQTGRIDLQKCLETFRKYLEENGQCINEKFEYDELKIDENSIQYKNFNAKNIIFCEGYGIKYNPYFNYLPVIGVKGEVLRSEVKQTGRIDLQKCLETFRKYLEENGQCINEKFEYDELKIDENSIQYKNFNAKNIIFCEGYGIKYNPYFNYLPVIGVKGEVL